MESVTGALAGTELPAGPARLLGHPGVVGALHAWCGPLEVAAVPPEGSVVIAVLGPPEVEALVDEALQAGAPVAVVCASEGEVVEPPPGGVWINDAWAGEGGRGVLGAGVLAAAQRSGVDVDAGLRGARGSVAAAQRPLADNPPWSLARALRLASAELGRDSVAHVSGPELRAFADWAARAQAGAMQAPSATVAARPLPSRAELGDLDWSAALASARDVVVILWQVGGAESPAAEALGGEGTPVLRVQLSALDAENLGAAFAFWISVLDALSALEQRGA